MKSSTARHKVAVGSTAALTIVVIALGFAACALSSGSSHLGTSTATTPATGETSGSNALATGSHQHSLTIDGTTRIFRTYVPSDLTPSEPVALVVMLHGGFGSAEQAESDYGWDAKADQERFIVAYPNGEGKAWNAGTCCGRSARSDVDDVAFVEAVVGSIEHQAHIDPHRIFVAGMSNGAMMAQRLACETDLFAAFASVSGAQMVSCADPEKISAIHIHGTADTNVPMNGSAGNGRGSVPTHTPVADSIAAWRDTDGCARASTSTSGVVTTSTATCPEGRAVTLITIAGAGHQWPGSSKKHPRLRKLLGMDTPSTAINATSVIWTFFAAHPKPA